ncbi:MAG: ABC transporter ATP-binding protein [Chloroflexi bacterium]|nr:ABC transporter ATP-binding protein [Chloroflexota bacterium]
MSNILELVNVTKTYKTTAVVDDISFSVKQGEIFGLLGPNGAGKSTTISMATGVLKPTAGRILLDGQDLRADLNRSKRLIGYVPQDLALYPTLSARDNLEFFGRIYGLSGRDLANRIYDVLEIVQLTDRANDAVGHFSGGMKRRVNLAAGLLHSPRLLFLDEPTVGVDPQSRNAIFESLEVLNREGMSIVYTTHYMEEAERLCARVAIVDHGKVIAMDTPANLIQRLGDGVIRLELQDANVAGLDQAIGQLDSVKQVTRRGNQLAIQSHRFEQTIIDAMQVVTRLNSRVTGMNLMEASLETVFLNLTGRSIRE